MVIAEAPQKTRTRKHQLLSPLGAGSGLMVRTIPINYCSRTHIHTQPNKHSVKAILCKGTQQQNGDGVFTQYYRTVVLNIRYNQFIRTCVKVDVCVKCKEIWDTALMIMRKTWGLNGLELCPTKSNQFIAVHLSIIIANSYAKFEC